jgi:hypothetical protein
VPGLVSLSMAGVARRTFLKVTGSLGVLALVPTPRLAALTRSAQSAPTAGQAGRFLSAHELDTLRSVTGRLLPGPPEDHDPGAVEAGAAEAIDMLLGAFTFDPPLIHAGGPFSNRAGSAHDDFADFVPLDGIAELGWRIRLEGSLGRPEREFAGPVRGLQQIYREDLAHLDRRSRSTYGVDFDHAPPPAQDVLLSDQTDSQTQELVGAALANTLEAVYGAPEYGGNRRLAGWTPIHWRGDVQPRGYTAAQVSQPDTAGVAGVLAPPGDTYGQQVLERYLPAAGGRGPSVARWWPAHRSPGE